MKYTERERRKLTHRYACGPRRLRWRKRRLQRRGWRKQRSAEERGMLALVDGEDDK